MRNRALGLAALGSLLLGGVAVASEQGKGEYLPQRSPEQIYEKTCGYCHGANIGPIILGRNLPAPVIESFVRMGPNAMPAFRPTEITDDELNALALWIQDSKADPKERGK